jgi:hypothetical protein
VLKQPQDENLVAGIGWRRFAAITAIAVAACGLADVASAASSKGCTGGGFELLLPGGGSVANRKGTLPASSLGDSFILRGKYVQFEVDSDSFAVRDYTLTGAANPLDITGQQSTLVFASKTPDHRGLALGSDLKFELKKGDAVFSRKGTGLEMKIQAKDCAQGGLFQMEVERGDATATDITHTLAPGAFYFDNPNFRNPPPLPLCPAGGPFTVHCYAVPVTPRINFANDTASKFVGRDSPQVATRLGQFGSVSIWRVASGGRMGMVFGEDAVEVGPPATVCTEDCQAQNQVKGRFPVLGFPFPVPAASRVTPQAP